MPDPAYGGTWYAETMIQAPLRPSLKGQVQAEICVVGGGLAGLTVAYELARAGKRVVLLEAERVACKASGRNGGFVIPGFALDAEDLIEFMKDHGGIAAAKDLWELSEAGVNYVRNTSEGIPSVHPRPGLLLVQGRDDLPAATDAAALYTSLGSNAVVWDTPAVRAALGSDAYFQAAYLPDAFHVHPLNYALGLADLITAAGGNIFEGSRAIDRDFSGPIKRVITPEGEVHANTVVLAQGADDQPLERKAQPVAAFRSFIAVTEPVGPPLPSKAVSDTRGVPLYHRLVDGNRLLWGSRKLCFSSSMMQRKIRTEIAYDYPHLATVGSAMFGRGKWPMSTIECR